MAIEVIPPVVEIFNIVETVLAYFGAIVIAYGGLVAIVSTVRLELKNPDHLSFKAVRGGFASRIILGLDFLIASDILTTIGNPGLNEVLALAGIVLIRTVLTLVLSQETKETERQKELARKA